MVKQLIQSYDEYVKLLISELEEIVPLAAGNGWRSTRHEAGIAYREKIDAQKSAVLAQLSHNKPSMPVCPHARLKWAVYDCTIKDSFALDLMDCNGEGTYSIPGNSGFGYSHQCNKVPGKPAHVG